MHLIVPQQTRGSDYSSSMKIIMNKKIKQILAIIGLVIIAGLYITTLVLALTGSESTRSLFTASIICTVIIPVFIYVASWLYKLLKGDPKDSDKPQ